MTIFPKKKARTVLAFISCIAILFSSPTAVAFASVSSSFYFRSSDNFNLQATEPQTTPDSNLTLDNTITFITPEVKIDYPASWNASQGMPINPYVDSIVTFKFLPEKNNTNNRLDYEAIVNIARHSLVPEVIKLEEYVGTQLYFLRNTIPGFNLLQFNKTTLDSRPAFQAIYTGLEGTEETKTMKLWASSGSFRYVVTYSTNAESFPTHLESVRNMTASLKITGAQAPPNLILVSEGLKHIPESSKGRVLMFANGLVLSSVFDSELVDFMEGTSPTLPSNFTKLPIHGGRDASRNFSAYYFMTPAYLSPESNNPEISKEPYKLLVLLFTNNTSNKLITEAPPINYRLTINGTNFDFEENGTASSGADIKILTGTSFVEALENPQQYVIGLDIQDLNN